MPSFASLWKKNDAEFQETYATVMDGLCQMYKKYLLELERDFRFEWFYSPLWTDGDFFGKPMLMVLGQYSTGKTTFLRYLLEGDYPGSKIGPEPTTDQFVAVIEGNTERQVPGNTAVADPNQPFGQLNVFGSAFLQRFQVSLMPCPLLKGISLIDTPGVLSGNKQTSRGYDFEGVVTWFAERVDMIILIFDTHKLDISDEFRRCIQAVRGNDSKVRILLNKADRVSQQQLVRIFGALMWSLSQVLGTPEVARVYIGSFWDKPFVNDENAQLFQQEEADLFEDIAKLPRNSATRKLNDLIKRAKLAKIHALLLSHLKKQLPLFGKESKKAQLVASLGKVYEFVSREHGINIGDFPAIDHMQKKLAPLDWKKIPKLDMQRIRALDHMLNTLIPNITRLLPGEIDSAKFDISHTMIDQKISPFLSKGTSSMHNWDAHYYLQHAPQVQKYRSEFESIAGNGPNALIGWKDARINLQKCGLPSSVLHRIWHLSDVDSDGSLNLEEYCIARHLIELKLEGMELPYELPAAWRPDKILRQARIDETPAEQTS